MRQLINICEKPSNKNILLVHTKEKIELVSFLYNLLLRHPQRIEFMSEYMEQQGFHDVFHILSNQGIGVRTNMSRNFDLQTLFVDENMEQAFQKIVSDETYLYIGYSPQRIGISDRPIIMSNKGGLHCLLPISPHHVLMWLPCKQGGKANRLLQLPDGFSDNLKKHYMEAPHTRFLLGWSDNK